MKTVIFSIVISDEPLESNDPEFMGPGNYPMILDGPGN